jgi:hypothetical protein
MLTTPPQNVPYFPGPLHMINKNKLSDILWALPPHTCSNPTRPYVKTRKVKQQFRSERSVALIGNPFKYSV